MQAPMREKYLHDLWNAARFVQIGRDVCAARLKVAKHGRAFAYRLEVIDGKRNLGCARNSEQVKHGIGGAAHGHDHRDRERSHRVVRR